ITAISHYHTLIYCHRAHLPRHSLPTRRSSDLASACAPCSRCAPIPSGASPAGTRRCCTTSPRSPTSSRQRSPARSSSRSSGCSRSEEHTSELQSRFDLVCRLLLEKKNYYYKLL